MTEDERRRNQTAPPEAPGADLDAKLSAAPLHLESLTGNGLAAKDPAPAPTNPDSRWIEETDEGIVTE